ncbi:MAG TPA: hypothetical protein PLF22_12180, partial [Pseudomonadales bacterium]|nr:hypothetical protein [Pseudomonadales bacterium]
MKLIRTLLVTSALVASSAYSWAGSNEQEIEHSKHHPAAAAENVAKPSSDQAGMSTMMAGMQDQMKKMQDTMQKIHAAKSDDERKALMKEHMTQMQEHMKMMKQMGAGGGMMSGMASKEKNDGMGMMGGDGMKCGMMDR